MHLSQVLGSVDIEQKETESITYHTASAAIPDDK